MKKIFIIVITFLLVFTNVAAKENKLTFKEDNNSVYYEASDLDEKIFMNHIEMTPGKTYTDELIIENKTNKTYDLFFKVNTVEQSKENEKLLDNILMRITLDDKEIYNGVVTGVEYENSDINLQDAIELGDFAKNETSKMVVELKLSEKYEVNNLNADSLIDWAFYAQYEDSKPVKIIEYSKKFNFPFLPLLALALVIGVDVVLALKIKETRKMKKLKPIVVVKSELILEIPKIDLKALYKSDDKAIIKNSVMPDENGKLLINDYFDRINELSAGDKAIITYKDTKYTYVVLDKFYIKSDGYVEVDNSSKCNTLSLINRNENTNKNTIIIILYVTQKEEK